VGETTDQGIQESILLRNHQRRRGQGEDGVLRGFLRGRHI